MLHDRYAYKSECILVVSMSQTQGVRRMRSCLQRLWQLVVVGSIAICGFMGVSWAGGFAHRHAQCHHCGNTNCQPCGQYRHCHHCMSRRCRGAHCSNQCGCHCHDGHCLKHDVIEKRYFLRSQGLSWHSVWYDPSIGRPLALVVPPTAEFTSEYSWGVPSSRVTPLYSQFRRPYPGIGIVPGAGGSFLPTPTQPSDTVQFGVYEVRGPWGAY